MIELGSVALELAAGVEDFTEHILHPDDLAPDGNLTAESLLQIRGRRQVIGMGVRLEQPIDCQTLGFHERDNRISRRGVCAAGRRVEVEDTVDDRRALGRGIPRHIARRVGRFVEERADFGLYAGPQRSANQLGRMVKRWVHRANPLLITLFM